MPMASSADPLFVGPDNTTDDPEMQRLRDAAELADAQYDLENERVW